MTNSIPITSTLYPVVCVTRLKSTTRTSWMANNAIPDSIIMNITCRSLLPPVELNDPNVRSTEIGLNSKNTLRILNTIKPVTRAFTAMDVAKPVRVNVFIQGAGLEYSCSVPIAANQVAIDDKLRLA
jgi:hypothetical protein